MRVLPVAALLVLAAAPLQAQDIVGRNDRVYEFSQRIPTNGQVNVFTPSGTITVTEASGSTMELRGEKERGEVEDMGYVVVRRDDGVTICAVFDDEDECRDSGLRRTRERNWRDNWRNRARINITVAVPRGVHVRIGSGNGEVSLTAAVATAQVSSGNGRVRVSRVQRDVQASSGNGQVTIDNVGGPVRASTGNGDVSVTAVQGPVNASSGNGDILATMDRLVGDDDLEFSSGNGRIEVVVPADFSADVEASTGNGRITTDFPIRIIGRIQPSRLRGTIGNGGRKLRMSTGNGAMEIRKR